MEQQVKSPNQKNMEENRLCVWKIPQGSVAYNKIWTIE